jgi:hypothetical protein
MDKEGSSKIKSYFTDAKSRFEGMKFESVSHIIFCRGEKWAVPIGQLCMHW